MSVPGSGSSVRRDQDEPTLIFVHGLACAREDWDGQIPMLSRHYRCIAVDLPGHSDAPAVGAIDMVALGAAVNEVKCRCSAGPVVLVGHSLGGKVIREAYRQSPDRVAGLIFVDASLYAADHAAIAAEARAAIARDGIKSFLQRLFAGMFFANSPPALRERLLRRAAAADRRTIEGLIFEQIRWESAFGVAALRRIGVPVLAVQATGFDSGFQRIQLQPGMTTPFIDALAAFVPDLEVRIIPNASHFVMTEAAEEVNSAIHHFVERLILGRPN